MVINQFENNNIKNLRRFIMIILNAIFACLSLFWLYATSMDRDFDYHSWLALVYFIISIFNTIYLSKTNSSKTQIESELSLDKN